MLFGMCMFIIIQEATGVNARQKKFTIVLANTEKRCYNENETTYAVHKYKGDTMTTLYLIRHGETQNNEQGRINGCHAAHPLNSNGVAQAQALHEALAALPVDAVYASPLPRARQTAAIAFGCERDEIPTVDGLKELDFGVWDGECYRIWPKHWMQEWLELLFDKGLEGGESAASAQRRICRALLSVYEKERGKTVAIVSHGTILELLSMALLDLPLTLESRQLCWGMRNTAFHCLEIDDDETVRITHWCDDAHLPQELTRFGHYTPSAQTAALLRAEHTLAPLRRIVAQED